MDHNYRVKWLTNQLINFNPTPVYVAIFGSYAQGSLDPGDCDVLIVLKSAVSSLQWSLVHDSLGHLKKRFEDCWNLKLSPTVLTLEEVSEEKSFISSILKKPLIDVFGSKNDLFYHDIQGGCPTKS